MLDVMDLRTCVAVLAVVDHVADELAAQPQALYLQHAGITDLDRLLAELDRLVPRAVVVAVSTELVHAAERRLVERRDELRADAPHVDARALLLDGRDQILVEIITRDDPRVGKATLVENSACFDREVREVAGVEANARELVAVCAHLLADRHRITHALER